MNQKAGLLFLSEKTERILLLLQDQKWTVPTFSRENTLYTDAQDVLTRYASGKILPIELYVSRDSGFEFSTYVCLVETEFLVRDNCTYCWSYLDNLPKNLHTGLRNTVTNEITKTKIQTILELRNNAT